MAIEKFKRKTIINFLIASCQENYKKYYYVVILGGTIGLTYLANTCNQSIFQVSNGYPKIKTPSPETETGCYDPSICSPF
jgi:hypothetical protein